MVESIIQTEEHKLSSIEHKKQLITEDLTLKYKRKECEDLLRRKFFFIPSFEIYGGVAGLYDYGPLGSCLKSNVEALWRQHFILEDDMLEVTCSNLTPEEVLKTSGHVEKFSDFMVKDIVKNQGYRADKLIEEFVNNVIKTNKKADQALLLKLFKILDDVGTMNGEQIDQVIIDLKIKAPDTKNELSKATPFNLMFETQIGPSGHSKGYLRPETAQGIFVNFRRLLEFNNNRMPFAAAQIGLGFRNEIHPKQGLLRVREFTMAEIEHFVDPENKSHKKFWKVSEIKLPLFSAENQEKSDDVVMIHDLTLQNAVEHKVINNETLAYFMARTYLFLIDCGIKKEAIRFRQHKSTEMAHYAQDCWDAEVETSYGWIEIAGHADRACFDLSRHAAKTKTDLVAGRYLKTAKKVEEIKVSLIKKEVSKIYKANTGFIASKFEDLTEEDKERLYSEIEANGHIAVKLADGTDIQLTKDLIEISKITKTIMEEKYTPSVIEPSFGIGRIVYCIFEHCFKVRENDAQRTYFTFPPLIAPLKCSILPLIDREELNVVVQKLKTNLIKAGVSSKIDDSGVAIGRRYARTDECGIPYAVTVDFDTLTDDTVTVRDLHTMQQVRMHMKDVPQNIYLISQGLKSWSQDILPNYPLFESKEKEDKEEVK